MTMTIRKQVDPDGTPVTVVRIIGERSNNTFLQIIRRAFNCWDRAPSDAKEFADMVEFGAPLQNYARQNGEEMLDVPGLAIKIKNHRDDMEFAALNLPSLNNYWQP